MNKTEQYFLKLKNYSTENVVLTVDEGIIIARTVMASSPFSRPEVFFKVYNARLQEFHEAMDLQNALEFLFE